MRISAQPGSPDERICGAFGVEVFLDGVRQDMVLAADTSEGWLRRFVWEGGDDGPRRRVVLDEHRKPLEVERRGVVALRASERIRMWVKEQKRSGPPWCWMGCADCAVEV